MKFVMKLKALVQAEMIVLPYFTMPSQTFCRQEMKKFIGRHKDIGPTSEPEDKLHSCIKAHVALQVEGDIKQGACVKRLSG